MGDMIDAIREEHLRRASIETRVVEKPKKVSLLCECCGRRGLSVPVWTPSRILRAGLDGWEIGAWGLGAGRDLSHVSCRYCERPFYVVLEMIRLIASGRDGLSSSARR